MGQGERPFDYGMAESLAFASLVDQGVPVRLSGEDSRRATFNQRHAVLIDTEDESEYCTLCNISDEQAFFEVHDSQLSEAGVLGFEYGFSRDYPEALTVWEAQFGDFANGGQIIIDQFITAGEDKWGLLSGLVLLLPHGYEGQGPEHSSARLERYLQAAAEDNIQVAYPSTAAQYFHLLRRQALRKWRKPLIVMTPKGMLRAKPATSPRTSFTRERFLTVMPEREPALQEGADRAVLATGKILHELRAERKKQEGDDPKTAILGLEQLYPFPHDELLAELDRLGPLREIVWVQEEPANMGALSFVMPELERLSRGKPVRSVKRAASASPRPGVRRLTRWSRRPCWRWRLLLGGGEGHYPFFLAPQTDPTCRPATIYRSPPPFALLRSKSSASYISLATEPTRTLDHHSTHHSRRSLSLYRWDRAAQICPQSEGQLNPYATARPALLRS